MLRVHRFLLIPLTLGALLTACIGDPNDPKTWIKKLNNLREQREAIQNLVRIDDKAAVPALIELYRDPKGSKDPELLEAIVHFHDPQSIPLLIETLKYTEQEFDHAAKAAEELGSLKAKQAVPALIAALDTQLAITSRANVVKQAVIRALAKIKDPAAVDSLCKVVKALPDEQDLFLNKVAALALGEIGDVKAVPCLLQAAFISRADGANVFQDVRVSIAKIGPAAIDPLIELLQEKNAAVNELGKKLAFKPGVIAYKAAYLLGDLRAKKAVGPLLSRLKEPPRGDMQRSILVALGQIGDPAGIDAALAVLKDGKQKMEHRQSACDAVVAAREMRALPALLAIAKDGKSPSNLRVAAAMALGRLGGKSEYEAFAPVAKAEQYAEFNEVIERLEITKECASDDCFIKKLDAQKLTHQEKAAFMLGAPKDREAALKALVAHLATPEPVIRLAILDSVRKLADKSCGDCQKKLQDLIGKEEKLTKVPAFTNLVNEMKVVLASLSHS